MAYQIGISLPKAASPGGICVSLTENDGSVQVIHLEGIEAGAPVSAVAEKIRSVSRDKVGPIDIYVDVTGRGEGLLDHLKQELGADGFSLRSIYLNHGTEKRKQNKLGKAYLVTNLKQLLELEKLRLPDTDEAEFVAKDLREVDLPTDHINPNLEGNPPFGSFDGLVTALGLSVQESQAPIVQEFRLWG